MTNTRDEELMTKLLDLLSELKIGHDLISEKMLISACLKYHKHQDKYEPDKIYTDLYDEIANEFHTNNYNVEKNIRHLITEAWNNGNPDVLYGPFAKAVPNGKYKATAKRFIKQVALLLDNE